MNLGRIKIWFSKKKKITARFYGGFLGREVVRLFISRRKKRTWEDAGCLNIARSMKALKDSAQKHYPFALEVSNYGFTTYWFWRFFLSIHTRSYHLENSR